MPDFRARCDQLVQAIDKYPVKPKAHRDLCNEVRAELEVLPPTEDELDEAAVFWWGDDTDKYTITEAINSGCMAAFADYILRRYGGVA
jgi:hypothetical protein